MKKVIAVLLILCSLSVQARLEPAGQNTISGVVTNGENNVYNDLQIGEGDTLIEVKATYGTAYPHSEFEFDDLASPLFVVFQQWVNKTGGCITLGSIVHSGRPIGRGWLNSELPEDVKLELMTDGIHLSICYDSDETRDYFGWVEQFVEAQ